MKEILFYQFSSFKKTVLILILCFSSLLGKSQQICVDTIAFDNMETFDWFGDWWRTPPNTTTTNTGFFNNASVSPNASAVIYGAGNGSSGVEQDWYVLPNINGLNPTSSYRFSFRLASYTFSNPGAATRGVDVDDFVEVQLSTNGGTTYVSEMRIRGFSNAFWNYNTLGVASKTANGVNTFYTPTAGGNRTTTGDGFSVIQLTIPSGITQIAVDILCRVNANGEEWWIDNVLLEEIYDCTILPIKLLNFDTYYQSSSKSVLLTWSAESDDESEFFIVEKSEDGIKFDSIGKIQAIGFGQFEYDFVDMRPNYNGVTYYRLKMNDYVNYEYSNVVAIEVNEPITDVQLYPNPFKDAIKITQLNDYNGPYQVSIYDMTGQTKLVQTLYFDNETGLSVDTKDLSAGLYTVIVKTSIYTKTFKMRK
jgi:hypothetical protein